jgi:small subunit ribosomal protein S16
MVKLRLRRKGRIHQPVYDIVAMDSRLRRDGAYLERLGFYDPNTQPSTIQINPDRALFWLNTGAQPTLIVKNLLSIEGVLLRKALGFKGKSQAEIEAEVTKHKETANARYTRRKELRKKRIVAKAKAKKEAENAPAAEAAPASE